MRSTLSSLVFFCGSATLAACTFSTGTADDAAPRPTTTTGSPTTPVPSGSGDASSSGSPDGTHPTTAATCRKLTAGAAQDVKLRGRGTRVLGAAAQPDGSVVVIATGEPTFDGTELGLSLPWVRVHPDGSVTDITAISIGALQSAPLESAVPGAVRADGSLDVLGWDGRYLSLIRRDAKGMLHTWKLFDAGFTAIVPLALTTAEAHTTVVWGTSFDRDARTVTLSALDVDAFVAGAPDGGDVMATAKSAVVTRVLEDHVEHFGNPGPARSYEVASAGERVFVATTRADKTCDVTRCDLAVDVLALRSAADLQSAPATTRMSTVGNTTRVGAVDLYQGHWEDALPIRLAPYGDRLSFVFEESVPLDDRAFEERMRAAVWQNGQIVASDSVLRQDVGIDRFPMSYEGGHTFALRDDGGTYACGANAVATPTSACAYFAPGRAAVKSTLSVSLMRPSIAASGPQGSVVLELTVGTAGAPLRAQGFPCAR